MIEVDNIIKILILIFGFFLGSAIGSFVNASVYRFKHGISIWLDRSKCNHCKKNIAAYDLIPIFSYLILRGKCRNCGKKIPIDCLITEIGFALLYLVLFIFYINGFISLQNLIIFIFWFIALGMIIVSDFLYLEIPDQGLFMGLIVSIIYIYFNQQDPTFSIFSGIVATIIFFIIFKLTGENKIGFGDVKLIFILGLFYRLFQLNFILLVSSLVGIIIGVIFSIIQKKNIRKVQVPFGSVLAIASILIIFLSFIPQFGEYLNNLNLIELVFIKNA